MRTGSPIQTNAGETTLIDGEIRKNKDSHMGKDRDVRFLGKVEHHRLCQSRGKAGEAGKVQRKNVLTKENKSRSFG